MIEKIKFKTSSIKEAEDYYTSLHMSVDQTKKVVDFSKILSQYLPISERAIKEFFWRVLPNFQMKCHMALNESWKLTPAERIEGLKEIFSLLKKE